jgi:putative membrane protein
MKIITREFLRYKFLNSLFMGLSIGSIFIIYTPLEPSVYSAGGIILALSMLLVAKLYFKILHVEYFYRISLFVELILLFAMGCFLLFSQSYTTALIYYISYQATFTFGSYLVRAETLFLKKSSLLSFVDVVKQKGYLVGMLLSYLFYKLLENVLYVEDKNLQVYNMNIALFIVELAIIFFLIRSFSKEKV